MTRLEAAIITAQTEVLIGDLDSLKAYASLKLGYQVQDTDFSEPAFWRMLKIKSRADFRKLQAGLNDQEDMLFLELVGCETWGEAA